MSEILVVEEPRSSFSEEIKKIRANLKFSSVDNDVKTIMVTSSVPGEGKSFISANLAAAFAMDGSKVLIIDCDMRKGRQNKIFNIPRKRDDGFSSLLINKNWMVEYKNYIKETKIPNLYVIPAGKYPPNPSELLASSKCETIIRTMLLTFDIVILDCPPLVGLNDSLVVSKYADTSLIVAKYASTSIDLLEKSKKSLDKVGAKKINVILNQINQKNSSYYYYGEGYYYGSNK